MLTRMLVILGVLPWACLASNSSFEKMVQPFLKTNCFLCHNAKMKVGGLSLDGYTNTRAALQNREVWEKVIQKLRTGQIPPKGQRSPYPQPGTNGTHWLPSELPQLDRTPTPDPS